MATNFTRQIEVVVVPSHNKNVVHIKGPMTRDEFEKFEVIANHIQILNSNRVIRIKYDPARD
jgi:ribosomal protein L14E/L6E/L27E